MLQGLLSGFDELEDTINGPWLAVQQLLVKGLFQPDTALLALETLATIAKQLALSGVQPGNFAFEDNTFTCFSLSANMTGGPGVDGSGAFMPASSAVEKTAAQIVEHLGQNMNCRFWQ